MENYAPLYYRKAVSIYTDTLARNDYDTATTAVWDYCYSLSAHGILSESDAIELYADITGDEI